MTLVLTGLVSFGMTRHIYDGGLLDENVSDDYKRQSLARGIIVPVGFALGIPVAFVSPVWAMWTWWLSIVALSWLVRSHYGEAIRHPYGTTT